MKFDVSLTAGGEWVIGLDFLAKWSTVVDSRDEVTAIETAKNKYRRHTSERLSDNAARFVESGWQYCMPEENVPQGRQVALAIGAKFYVGEPCGRHQLNCIRYTSCRRCPICAYEKQLGIV